MHKNLIFVLLVFILITQSCWLTNPEDEKTTGSVTDIDGNVYKVVKIGEQYWMAENLKVTHYRNGDEIPNITDKETWDGIRNGALCYYNNIDSNATIYGCLYNWYAIENNVSLAPKGWHIPTDDEWKELEMYLGMVEEDADDIFWRGSDEASQLKSATGWNNDGNGTDDYSFSALPCGYRSDLNDYTNQGKGSAFWSSTEYDNDFAWMRRLGNLNSDINRNGNLKTVGLSIRCIKD